MEYIWKSTVGQSIIFILLFQEIFLYCPKTQKKMFRSRENIIDEDQLSYSLTQSFLFFAFPYSPPRLYTDFSVKSVFHSVSLPLPPSLLSLSLTVRAQHSRQEVDADLTLA